MTNNSGMLVVGFAKLLSFPRDKRLSTGVVLMLFGYLLFTANNKLHRRPCLLEEDVNQTG